MRRWISFLFLPLILAVGCKHVDINTDILVKSIKLSDTAITLVKGDDTQLTATVSPADASNKEVKWTSSNTSVATVEDGRVTAVSIGTATITATAGSQSATCEVEVVAVPVPVTGLTIEPSEVSVAVGGSEQLRLIFTPSNATNRNVKWYIDEFDDKEVASISAGNVVTGKKKGKVMFTAVSEDNDDVYASVSVSVVEPFTSVKIDTPDLEEGRVLDVGKTCQLTATATPASSGDRVVWEITGGDTYATITSEGLLKGVKAGGTVTVTARSMANPKVSDIHSFNTYSPVTGLEIVPVGSALTQRPTKYIGAGKTQKWTILIKPETAYLQRSVSVTGFNSGNALFSFNSFSTADNVLTVTAPSSRISSKDSECSGSVRLSCRSGDSSYGQDYNFIVTELDPFLPKFGDLVYYDNVNNKVKTIDYGYRGKGIVEKSLGTVPNWKEKFGNVVKQYRVGIIGYIGNEHLSEDPFLVATGYSLPGIEGLHGILVPFDCVYASRTSSPYGWQVPSDGKEQFCSESDNLSTRQGPGVSGIDMGRLRDNATYRSTHFAFHNTAALLWYNMSRGDSHNVRPEIYFASNVLYNLLGKPSGDAATRFNTMTRYEFGTTATRVGTPWLFPGEADMSSIFSGQGAIQQASTSVVKERANILVLSMDKFSDTTVEAFANKTYWVHHDSTDGMASLVLIRDDYAMTSGSSKKNYVFYVLPICYF